jgi:hypothetical protein
MSASTSNPPADRLLTPLGGLVLALVLTLVVFWLPLLSLLA